MIRNPRVVFYMRGLGFGLASLISGLGDALGVVGVKKYDNNLYRIIFFGIFFNAKIFSCHVDEPSFEAEHDDFHWQQKRPKMQKATTL